jgi:hypothetical protein
MNQATSNVTAIAARLYMDRPSGSLFHYTSLRGFLGIITEGELQITDARYLNDASEMRVFVERIKSAMSIDTEFDEFTDDFHKEFGAWLDFRISDHGHSIFVACFTGNGNLLSQWRSYGDPGKNLSIGFNPDALQSAAHSQGYILGRCIYDATEQSKIAKEVLAAIKREAGSSKNVELKNVFTRAETNLLKIAILFKDQGFREEEEWRLVSPPVDNYVNFPIQFREGRTMLTPFMKFVLPSRHDSRIDIEQAFVGPTPHINAAMSATLEFLSKLGVSPRRGLCYCQIPYRNT